MRWPVTTSKDDVQVSAATSSVSHGKRRPLISCPCRAYNTPAAWRVGVSTDDLTSPGNPAEPPIASYRPTTWPPLISTRLLLGDRFGGR